MKLCSARWGGKDGETESWRASLLSRKTSEFVASFRADKVGLKQAVFWQQIMETLNSEKKDKASALSF